MGIGWCVSPHLSRVWPWAGPYPSACLPAAAWPARPRKETDVEVLSLTRERLKLLCQVEKVKVWRFAGSTGAPDGPPFRCGRAKAAQLPQEMRLRKKAAEGGSEVRSGGNDCRRREWRKVRGLKTAAAVVVLLHAGVAFPVWHFLAVWMVVQRAVPVHRAWKRNGRMVTQ